MIIFIDKLLSPIGATIENLYFEVNLPLLSRLRIVKLSLLSPKEIKCILRTALTDDQRDWGFIVLRAQTKFLMPSQKLRSGASASS